MNYLNEANIETRQVFGGNILKQPGFKNIDYRLSGNLDGTNFIMENTIFFGLAAIAIVVTGIIVSL